MKDLDNTNTCNNSDNLQWNIDAKNQTNNTTIPNFQDERMLYRVGILGAAKIARKNIHAIQHLYSGCKLTAIASRSRMRAEKIVEDHAHIFDCMHMNGNQNEDDRHSQNSIEIFAGESAYMQLIESIDLVDAIYIPLPTSLHSHYVTAALQAGKHVLVEKPVSVNVSDYRKFLGEAKVQKKYLQDGTMFVHHPRTKQFLDIISNREEFGEVTRIHADFSFYGDEEFFEQNIRTSQNGDPLGCIGDLGWYCVRMALLVFHRASNARPISARVVHSTTNQEGVPIDAICIVTFQSQDVNEDILNNSNAKNSSKKESNILSFHCSFVSPLRQRVEVCSKQKSATINDFVIPQSGINHFQLHKQDTTENDEVSIQTNDLIEVQNSPSQEVMMWRFFSQACHCLDTDPESYYENLPSRNKNYFDFSLKAKDLSDMSLQTQMVMDALMKSIKTNGKEISIMNS